MTDRISARLAEMVEALPLHPGMRVLEVGCGPGVAARAVLRRMGKGRVLAIDRSAKAIAQAVAGSGPELATGQLEYRCVAVEDFTLAEGERPYDLAFAVRVGALDGRHPEAGRVALGRDYWPTDREIHVAATVPSSHPVRREVRQADRTSRPLPRLIQCRQRLALPSKDSSRAGPPASGRPLPLTSPW